MQVVHERCAGIDVHKRRVVVTVLLTHEERVEKQTRTFGTMTDDLLALSAWLERHHVRRLEQLGYTVTLTPAEVA